MGAETVLKLCESADVLIEGFRPGVAERLGIGPDVALERNPRLVYGRMTGWGQVGPIAHDVGHDINYIALAGVLAHIGTAGGPPVPPINLVGDFGGGGLLLAFGILAALLERGTSGEGQVIDAAMVDGAAMQMSVFVGMNAMGFWSDERGHEPARRWRALLRRLRDVRRSSGSRSRATSPSSTRSWSRCSAPLGIELDPATQMDQSAWPGLKARMAELFRTRTRDEWADFFAGHEVCFAPVLTMNEARGASAQRRARDVHGGRGRAATRAGPALQPDSGRDRAHTRGRRAPIRTMRSWTGASTPAEIAQLKEQGAIA